MSEIVRLTLVSHALTDAMTAGRFPADEPLNAVGHRQVDGLVDAVWAGSRPADTAYCGTEKRARQTAELFGLTATVDPRLAALDWRALARRTAERGAARRPRGSTSLRSAARCCTTGATPGQSGRTADQAKRSNR